MPLCLFHGSWIHGYFEKEYIKGDIIGIRKMEINIQTLQKSIMNDKLKKQIDYALHPKSWTGKWILIWDWISTIIVYLITFIITLIIVVIVDHYVPFFNLSITSNPNSARYLLSSLIQSQAAILAIVVTITLIAVQLAASSYSPRVIDIFKRNVDFIVLLLLYGLSIFYLSGILKIIPEEKDIFQNLTTLHTKINSALVISFFTFTMLFPYISRTINLLKPSNIIEVLAKDITKDNILKPLNHNMNVKNTVNPLMPILDIIQGSCMKHDFETTRKGLKEIGDKVIDLFNNGLSESEADSVISLFVDEIESFGKFAVNIGDDNSSNETVKTLHHMNKIFVEKNIKSSNGKINVSLKSIGVAATEKKLTKTSQGAIDSLYEIGKISININSDISEQSILLLGDLARSGIENKLENSTHKAIWSIRYIGIMAVKKGLETSAKKALWSLELIGKTQKIYQQKLRFEKWEKFVQTWEVEGEIFEEIIEPGGIEQEISLFNEVLWGVFFIGTSSIKVRKYTISQVAIITLKIIGETAIKNGFDDKGVPAFLGNLGMEALDVDNKELANSSVKTLKKISIAAGKNLEATEETAWSLIRVGTVALQKGLKEMASLAAQTLVDMTNNKISTNRIDSFFNESRLDIREFKKLYLELKRKIKRSTM